MNTIEQAVIITRNRGRPIGSKNSTTIEEHNLRQAQRKKNLQINFQKYKAEHHDELKKAYIEHYNNNRNKKLGRMNELYRLKSHIKQLMKYDVAILN